MNLVAELQKKHSLASKNRMIRYVGTDRKRFGELVKIFLGGNYRLTQWAGWPLSDIVKTHPDMISPYLRSMLKSVDRPNMHEAVKRNVMRLMQFVEIPKSYRGLAFEKAFTLFTNPGEPIAVRVFAMQVMTDISMLEPELKNEVIIAIEQDLPYGSPAYRSRANRLLKKLKK
ncbi:MAG TPA: hypothetical protein VFE50_05205 [Cyclobacteriaceae bacterium]|nr:hypothetical protein [Cyclobacteriaceae bacterium]